jgi:tetratricopeptide (TPR) repeat protein
VEGEERAMVYQSGSLKRAIQLFEQAIDLDPAYVRAYAALAPANYDLLDIGEVPKGMRPELERQARRAVDLAKRLDPDSADVISLMGLQLDNRHLRAQAWERAIKLDPDHAVSYYRYAVQKKNDGDLESAEELIKTANSLRLGNERYRAEQAEIFALQGKNP